VYRSPREVRATARNDHTHRPEHPGASVVSGGQTCAVAVHQVWSDRTLVAAPHRWIDALECMYVHYLHYVCSAYARGRLSLFRTFEVNANRADESGRSGGGRLGG